MSPPDRPMSLQLEAPGDPCPAAKPLLSVLVVTYESRGFIGKCLSAIPAACAAYSYEILLIDNGNDGTASYVAEVFPEVRIVPSQGNIGFGKANNILAEQARGEFLALVNPDAEPLPGSLDRLIELARTYPEFGAIAGHCIDPHTGRPQLGLNELPRITGMIRGTFGVARKDMRILAQRGAGLSQVEVATGGFAILRSDAWKQIGGFDPSYFLYGEDIELSLALTRAGWHIGSSADARAYHESGSGEFFSPWRQHRKMLGTVHFVNRNFPPISRILFKLALWIQCVVRFSVGGALGSFSPRFRAMSRSNRQAALMPWRWWAGYG